MSDTSLLHLNPRGFFFLKAQTAQYMKTIKSIIISSVSVCLTIFSGCLHTPRGMRWLWITKTFSGLIWVTWVVWFVGLKLAFLREYSLLKWLWSCGWTFCCLVGCYWSKFLFSWVLTWSQPFVHLCSGRGIGSSNNRSMLLCITCDISIPVCWRCAAVSIHQIDSINL